MEEIFKVNPSLIALISVKDGKALLETCDERISVTEIMVLLNKFTQEYLEAIAAQSKIKETEDGQEEQR